MTYFFQTKPVTVYANSITINAELDFKDNSLSSFMGKCDNNTNSQIKEAGGDEGLLTVTAVLSNEQLLMLISLSGTMRLGNSLSTYCDLQWLFLIL